METCEACSVWVMFISLSLLMKCETHPASKHLQATVYDRINNGTSLCHDGLMSVYISKEHFADLPFTIYVRDKHGGYYQAIAIAEHCHYFLEENDTFIIFTASSRGCFVQKQEYVTALTIVIVALAESGGVDIIKSIPVVCEIKMKEANEQRYPLLPQGCNKDGFNITIPQNVTVPPLNLDEVWIASSQSHSCKPRTRSKDAITFSFPFTDCGTQSTVAGDIITYWVSVEGKAHRPQGSIFRDTPFHLTVRCSFSLAHVTRLGVKVQREKPEHPSTLKSKGILRAEMRFAKDSSYRSFYSSRDPVTVTELGQPVYVEVFVLKHEDKDLELLLQDCWATPTEDPHHPQRWNLLAKGCPFGGDSHRTVVLPVVSSKELVYPSLHKWFVVKLFSFVKSPTFENQVYFHCDIEICKGPDCSQSCSSGRRKLRRITAGPGQGSLYGVISSGPLLYLL